MGLAASQARFLGITARKNACEQRSIEIAQERLSVSNQLSQASQNYMTSLNATKIIWNPEHTDDNYIYQLDYASMSRPKYFNDYQLQLLTNIKGQTVLDNAFYDALCGRAFTKADGTSFDFANALSDGGGQIERNIDNFKTFIGALHEQGIVSNAQYTQMTSALNYQERHPNSAPVYHPENGFGVNGSTLRQVYSTDLLGLCDYIDDITLYGEDYLNELYDTYGSNPLAPTPYDTASEIVSLLNFNTFWNEVSGADGISVVKNACTPQPAERYYKEAINGGGDNVSYPYAWEGSPSVQLDDNIAHVDDWSHPEKFNLSDALGSNMLALVGYGERWGNNWSHAFGNNFAAYVNLIDSFINNLENIAKKFFEYTGVADEDALARTKNVIETLYKNADGSLRTTDANFQYSDNDGYGLHDSNDTYIGGLPDYLNYCIPVVQRDEGGNNNLSAVCISLSNLAQAFFTEYENQRSLGTSGYFVASSTGYTGDCNLVTSSQAYVYDYIDAGTSNPDGEVSQILNYYSQMFNQICEKGYVYNSAVDEPEKLQNMLKNGYLAVNTIGDDNYFYQYDYLAYTIGSGYFKEVPDENAITTAEAEYKVRQAQLNAKEEELSVDMQTVEAELAALNTEYDTVKNLISKSVQKDFTTCGG